MNTTHACHRILVAILLFSADFNEEGITALAQRVKKVLPASPPVSLIPLPRAEIENDEFSSDVDDVDDYVLSPLDEYSCDVEDAAHFKAAKAMKNQGVARTSGTSSRAQRSKAAFVAGRKQAVAVKRATDRSSTQATRVMRLSKESHLCVGLGSPVRVGGVPPGLVGVASETSSSVHSPRYPKQQTYSHPVEFQIQPSYPYQKLSQLRSQGHHVQWHVV